jgi:hypothetical protein
MRPCIKDQPIPRQVFFFDSIFLFEDNLWDNHANHTDSVSGFHVVGFCYNGPGCCR